MNEKLDEIQGCKYKKEEDINQCKALKDTRYLLLSNGM